MKTSHRHRRQGRDADPTDQRKSMDRRRRDGMFKKDENRRRRKRSIPTLASTRGNIIHLHRIERGNQGQKKDVEEIRRHLLKDLHHRGNTNTIESETIRRRRRSAIAIATGGIPEIHAMKKRTEK